MIEVREGSLFRIERVSLLGVLDWYSYWYGEGVFVGIDMERVC